MFSWRVTKYDPKYRNDRGHYMAPDWTSYADVGRERGGKVLDREEYLRVETAYVEAAKSFLRSFGDDPLKIVGLETSNAASRIRALEPGDPIANQALPREGDEVRHADLDRICRLILREILWCKLEAERGRFFIHFGWDFYMYIGSQSPSEEAIQSAEASGLFVEPMLSPYLK